VLLLDFAIFRKVINFEQTGRFHGCVDFVIMAAARLAEGCSIHIVTTSWRVCRFPHVNAHPATAGQTQAHYHP
jgi:hypothetical protein